LSGLARSWRELAILQAAAGTGLGSEWAAGVALLSEPWPERSRTKAVIVMLLSFAVGFFLAALLNLVIGPAGWRHVFAAGAAPALITIFLRIYVPEPERWLLIRNHRGTASTADNTLSTILAMFAPEVLLRTIVGVLVAASMMIATYTDRERGFNRRVTSPRRWRWLLGRRGLTIATQEQAGEEAKGAN
jgi:MFS family permease